MTTAQGDTASQAWRCQNCHQPLGYLVRRGRRHALIVVVPGTLDPLVELRAGAVYCLCGASREWYPDDPKHSRKPHNTAT